MKNPLWICLALTLGLAGCASTGPTVTTHTSPGADLSQFVTFGYVPRLGTDRSEARSGFSQRLIASVNHELTRRGMELSTDPELMIDFNFVTRDGVNVRQIPNSSMMSVHRAHWHQPVGVWTGYRTTVTQYTEGTLLVDFIDVQNNQLVAEGAARGRSTNSINTNDFTQGKIMTVIAQIMDELMPR